MRRLKILPCSESWSEMRSEGADGIRWCDHCAARVSAVAELEAPELDVLLEQASESRVCMRLELERGRPKLASGLASAMIVALASCASAPEPEPAILDGYAATVELEPLWEEAGSEIVGFAVHMETGEALEGVSVSIDSEVLAEPISTETDARGMYGFANLAAGSYVVTVHFLMEFAGRVELPAHARARASFAINPNPGEMIVMGFVYEDDPRFSSPGPHLINPHDS